MFSKNLCDLCGEKKPTALVNKVTAIAAFDFDHTLTSCETLRRFLCYRRPYWDAAFRFTLLSPIFLAYLCGLISRQQTKERVLSSFFGGYSTNELKTLAEDFATHALDGYLQEGALDRIRWHQKQGHRCILISASPEVYLSPWAMRHGFDAVLASRLDIDAQNRISGKLLGKNCWGPEKKRRLLEYIDTDFPDKLYVYGDSRGDREILEMATNPFFRPNWKEINAQQDDK